MVGYVRQATADILPGEDVTAEPLYREFNRLAQAFGTTGHTHDGTPGNAPLLPLATSVSGFLPASNGGTGGLNNNTAVSAPTITDDATKGYVPGSMWINTSARQAYQCVSNQTGAAIWNLIQAPTGTFLVPANNLNDVSDKAVSRSNLGLVVGTDVQAYNIQLDRLATGGTTANRIPYGSASGYQTFIATAYSRGLMANADASNWKDSLGLIKATGTVLKALTDDTTYVTPKANADAMAFVLSTTGGSITPDLSTGFNRKYTLNANSTFNTPTGMVEGQSFVLILTQDGTGSRTATFSSAYNFGADGVPTLSTVANGVDYIFGMVLPGATSAICSFKPGQ